MLRHWILTVAVATHTLSSAASPAVTLEQVIDVVAASTGLNIQQQFSSEAEGLQHLYLHLLRAVHAHDALPYHSGDWWGTYRGEASLDRLALNMFLEKTSRHVKTHSRYVLKLYKVNQRLQ